MNKNIINLLKSINGEMSIREVEYTLEEVIKELIDLNYELNDECISKDIHRITHMIDNIDIYDMPLNEIEEYIDRLITIIDFCIQ